MNGDEKFYAALGRFVVEWTRAENAMRTLVLILTGASKNTQILTAELQSQAIIHALKGLSESRPKEIQEAIATCILLFERIREYRNYYVHGISMIKARPGTDDLFGLVLKATAKGKFNVTEDAVTAENLDSLTRHCLDLETGVWAIVDTVDPREGSLVDPPLPSMKLVSVPEILRKTYRYPIARRS